MRFDWTDVLAMSSAGLFGELDRPELVDGEAIILPVEGPLHRPANLPNPADFS